MIISDSRAIILCSRCSGLKPTVSARAPAPSSVWQPWFGNLGLANFGLGNLWVGNLVSATFRRYTFLCSTSSFLASISYKRRSTSRRFFRCSNFLSRFSYDSTAQFRQGAVHCLLNAKSRLLPPSKSKEKGSGDFYYWPLAPPNLRLWLRRIIHCRQPLSFGAATFALLFRQPFGGLPP